MDQCKLFRCVLYWKNMPHPVYAYTYVYICICICKYFIHIVKDVRVILNVVIYLSYIDNTVYVGNKMRNVWRLYSD